jgi:hypothetical protein
MRFRHTTLRTILNGKVVEIDLDITFWNSRATLEP